MTWLVYLFGLVKVAEWYPPWKLHLAYLLLWLFPFLLGCLFKIAYCLLTTRILPFFLLFAELNFCEILFLKGTLLLPCFLLLSMSGVPGGAMGAGGRASISCSSLGIFFNL